MVLRGDDSTTMIVIVICIVVFAVLSLCAKVCSTNSSAARTPSTTRVVMVQPTTTTTTHVHRYSPPPPAPQTTRNVSSAPSYAFTSQGYTAPNGITLQVAPPVIRDPEGNAYMDPPPLYTSPSDNSDTVITVPPAAALPQPNLTEELQLTRHPRPTVTIVVDDDDHSTNNQGNSTS
ncbi:hypothetical protein B0O80DRAFT_451813 [Mortierella sp. GBAus27b]|nr:hypothetical protein B0O80DRAFT_451813 [Mortierella sp. GBAus27b]